jgi:zinc/manganese transport system substrate-binding protein
MKALGGLALAAALALSASPAAQISSANAASAVKLVAAENFYGGIAQQIGGLEVEVVSVMNKPDQDPHLFETSPAVARQLAAAQIVIYNGADYDPWMPNLLAATPRPGRMVIDVADLVGRKAGDNPHFWYDPPTMPKAAQALADALSKADPDHAADYAARLKATLAALARVQARVKALRARWAGTWVTATEPVFGYMADAVGLTMRNQSFQLATMNDTEPSAKDIAAFQDDLKNHKVKALITNKQVSGTLTRQLIAIAEKAKVPVVAVTETQPADTTFQDWMLSELDALDKALAGPNS